VFVFVIFREVCPSKQRLPWINEKKRPVQMTAMPESAATSDKNLQMAPQKASKVTPIANSSTGVLNPETKLDFKAALSRTSQNRNNNQYRNIQNRNPTQKKKMIQTHFTPGQPKNHRATQQLVIFVLSKKPLRKHTHTPLFSGQITSFLEHTA
jgi:hypothetical protein